MEVFKTFKGLWTIQASTNTSLALVELDPEVLVSAEFIHLTSKRLSSHIMSFTVFNFKVYGIYLLHLTETAQGCYTRAVVIACCSNVYLKVHTSSFGPKLCLCLNCSNLASLLNMNSVLKLNVAQVWNFHINN